MHKRRNVYTRRYSPAVIILTSAILVCVILGIFFSLIYPRPEEDTTPTTPTYVQNTAPDVLGNTQSAEPVITAESTAEPTPAPTPAPAVGMLLESGTNINDNYYKKVDFSGTPSDMTGSTFVLGKEHPATNTKLGADHPGSLTIHYGPDTLIKTAQLYYADDRYEIYMGSANDLSKTSGYIFEVILVDPGAAELWAKEIIISEFIF